jgi:amino acid transporter
VAAVVLYLFRDIYAEVVTALPVNGGTYTLLLNSTSKFVASLAGALTVLSYIATAVVGASVSVAYIRHLVDVPLGLGTVGVLGFFAFLNLLGIKESSRIATLIFVVHCALMVVLAVDCSIWTYHDGFHQLVENWNNRFDILPDGRAPYSFFPGLLFGFSSAMLGITGFETSANYVEEQAPGVFVKTLRNMWIIVAFMNPILAFLAICVLPLTTVMGYPLVNGRPQNEDLLIQMAPHQWLQFAISIDAFLVLAGSVLTAYVGIGGLLKRMAMDDCFPKFLTQTNRCFGSAHFIIIGFFAVCSALYFLVDMNVLILGGVFSIAFLLVMTLYCAGNMVLKYKRSKLRRLHRANSLKVLTAACLCMIAVYGNIALSPNVLPYFFLYYGVTCLVILIMFQKVRLLRMILRGLIGKIDVDDLEDEQFSGLLGCRQSVARRARKELVKTVKQSFVFFLKSRNICLMNKALAYLRDNEQALKLIFVHVTSSPAPEAEEEVKTESSSSLVVQEEDVMDPVSDMKQDLQVLQRIYPKMSISLEIFQSPSSFDAASVRNAGKALEVPPHRMFISCPNQNFPYDIAELGGVRLITH